MNYNNEFETQTATGEESYYDSRKSFKKLLSDTIPPAFINDKFYKLFFHRLSSMDYYFPELLKDKEEQVKYLEFLKSVHKLYQKKSVLNDALDLCKENKDNKTALEKAQSEYLSECNNFKQKYKDVLDKVETHIKYARAAAVVFAASLIALELTLVFSAFFYSLIPAIILVLALGVLLSNVSDGYDLKIATIHDTACSAYKNSLTLFPDLKSDDNGIGERVDTIVHIL